MAKIVYKIIEDNKSKFKYSIDSVVAEVIANISSDEYQEIAQIISPEEITPEKIKELIDSGKYTPKSKTDDEKIQNLTNAGYSEEDAKLIIEKL